MKNIIQSQDPIFNSIFLHVEQKNCRVIGINGVDTSGKTVFAQNLCNYFLQNGKRAVVVHLDDFHNPKSVRNQGENAIDSYIQNAFNLDLLVDEILKPHKNMGNIDITLSLLYLESDRFDIKKHFLIEPDMIVILEGVLLFRPPLVEYIDCKVFLDISFDEVLSRASKRDVLKFGTSVLEKYQERYIPA